MEFTLDLALVRGILKQERRRLNAEIPDIGVLPAFALSQRRHDERIAAAADVESLACHAGCTWCCHFTVDVRPAEVFILIDYVATSLSPEERARIYSEVRANAQLLRGLSDDERVTRNIKCAFLSDGRCAAYGSRPQSCRNYHATDVTGCELSYEQPENLDIDPDFAPGVYQSGAAHVEAVSNAMQAAGFDTEAYELNAAIEAALSDPDARLRFPLGQKAFKDLNGQQVVTEFDDLDP